MICDDSLVLDVLDEKKNLCLKKNLLSLQDLYMIYNGTLIFYVKNCY